jgi:MFS family permease
MPILLIAISAMLVQQTIATTAKVGMPVLFPAIAGELGIDPEMVLVYTWAYAVFAIGVMAGCGGVIQRWGALRTSQIGCLLIAAGLTVAALFASPWSLVPVLGLAVLLNSLGATVATPASSQILSKYAPPKWAPLVFSIKQTGVPAGIAISGLILTPLAVAYDWRVAILGLAGVCVLIAIALQPLRAEFDEDRDPTARPQLKDFTITIRAVIAHSGFRTLAMGAFTFVGIQSLYMNFTITYLTQEIGYDLEAAGAALGLATLLAVPARIFWGWVGSTLVRPSQLLAGLAVIMAGSTAAMGAIDSSWGPWAVLAVTSSISLSVLSWHGVLLSEAARLAPASEVGRMTGGVLAFGSAGQVIFPMIFGLGYAIGGYTAAYIAISAPAILVGWLILRGDKRDQTR